MKYLKIKFLILFVINMTYSQNITVEYSEKITRNKYSVLNHKYTLHINKNESLYDQVFESKLNTEEKKGDDEGITTTRKIYPTEERMKFVYRKNGEIIFKDIIASRDVVVKEEKINFNWKLYKETKKIGSYKCKKAITYFRGRNYIAWYAEDLATTAGPAKFYGLPGLILEIYDENKIFHVQAKKINLKSENLNFSKKVEWIKKSKKIDIKEYFKQKNNEREEEINELNSKLEKNEPRYKLEDSPKSEDVEIYQE